LRTSAATSESGERRSRSAAADTKAPAGRFGFPANRKSERLL